MIEILKDAAKRAKQNANEHETVCKQISLQQQQHIEYCNEK